MHRGIYRRALWRSIKISPHYVVSTYKIRTLAEEKYDHLHGGGGVVVGGGGVYTSGLIPKVLVLHKEVLQQSKLSFSNVFPAHA